MKLSILKVKIERNEFVVTAGEYYKDENSEIVTDLKKLNKKALLGIQRMDGVYTILGEDSVYYKTVSGNEGEIDLVEFLSILNKVSAEKGKLYAYQFINVNDSDSIWVLNKYFMSSMWNTMLYLSASRRNK